MVDSIEEDEEKKTLIQSKHIICPKCQENICFIINDYKIYLSNCKNRHRINSILLDEFEKTQKIDLQKIICNSCNNNKSKAYKHEFYKCFSCRMNLCPLCKSSHNNKHHMINYDQKYYFCEKHYGPYIKYCNECKINICLLCENEHKNHNNESYGYMIPDIDKIKEGMDELKKEIDLFNENVKKIINKLKKVMDNIEIYYKINNDIMNNYEIKEINYETLQNINEINNSIIEDIKNINNDNNINNQVNNLLNIYNKMINKDIIFDTDKKKEFNNISLEKKDIEITKKINEFIKLISSYKNYNKVENNLELLGNCKKNNIQDIIIIIKNKIKEDEKLLLKDKQEYESYIIKNVFKTIVPSFSQDIIASMFFAKVDKNYNKIKDFALEIYKKSLFNNFDSFFKQIESKNNIIYTFSKINENLFEDNKQIENKFGIFSKQDITDEMMESYASENDLIFLLKT